jgi:hypothetical protein
LSVFWRVCGLLECQRGDVAAGNRWRCASFLAPARRSASGRYCCKSRKSNDAENLAKSDVLDVSTAAMLARPDTKVRGRICVKRCGPSRRRARTASAVLKKFCLSARKDFFNSIGTFRIQRDVRLESGMPSEPDID